MDELKEVKRIVDEIQKLGQLFASREEERRRQLEEADLAIRRSRETLKALREARMSNLNHR